ncbi:MAG: HPF/RaiA family ribosome-associated protein [Proteobacteria bacterium]|nr:HPF/RaiA family ribosome-associated protein [Pseudomonadota bacterium]
MQIDVQSRGFSLSRALQRAIEGEARQYAAGCANVPAAIRVRIYDNNGPRGGIDKSCLVQATLPRSSQSVIVSHVDADMYRAIAVAFAKLTRATRSLLERRRSKRRFVPATLSQTAG